MSNDAIGTLSVNYNAMVPVVAKATAALAIKQDAMDLRLKRAEGIIAKFNPSPTVIKADISADTLKIGKVVAQDQSCTDVSEVAKDSFGNVFSCVDTGAGATWERLLRAKEMTTTASTTASPAKASTTVSTAANDAIYGQAVNY